MNVESVDKINLTIGHVDNTSLGDTNIEIYLDGILDDRIVLSPNEVVPYEIKTENVSVLRIERTGSVSRYAVADITFDGITPENTYRVPDYRTSSAFVSDIFNSYRTEVFDGSYSTGSGISFNVENLSSISFDLGHVDNSSTNSAVFHIYLDNEEVKEIELSYQKPIEPCEFDLSSADTMRIYCDGSQSRYAMANIIVDEIAPKHSFSVPEYETAADFISSNYDTFRSEFYDGDDQFKTFTVDGKEYSLGFILGDTSYSSGAAVSFNVEKLDEVSFSMGVIGENQDSKEKLYIYKDGKQTEEILLTPENIAKMKNYTIDTRGVSTIRIYKDSDKTRYGFTEISVKPASQPDEPEITTTAVTTTPPVSVTTEPSVTTPPENVTTPPETTVTAMTTTTVTDTSEYDLNGDGKLSTSDVRCLLQHLVGSVTLKEEALKKADINKDGSVDTADAVKLLRKAAGMTETE